MGTLHVVATPIGNLEDVTLRALRVLGEAELVFAEDTRRTRILLDRHRIASRPLSLHAHNEESRIARALEALEGGGSVALVSDAGTPLVSDPGERLLAAVIAAGHRVEAVPGASAVLAALAVSGLPCQPFAFLGFLPRRGGVRRSVLGSWRGRPETLVLFESPRRLSQALADLEASLGNRPACVARELTKLHEEVRRGSLSELAAHFAGDVFGEVSIVVAGVDAVGDAGRAPEGAEAGLDGDDAVDAAIREGLAAGLRPRQIASKLAERARRSKRELYARALALRDDGARGA
jgi:16S rRNA (cytidine1402-2'-O)-methyltransferase